jgi:hypothetical protein
VLEIDDTTITNFQTLTDLLSRDFLSTADYARVKRLIKIVARERNLSTDDVITAATVSGKLNK